MNFVSAYFYIGWNFFYVVERVDIGTIDCSHVVSH